MSSERTNSCLEHIRGNELSRINRRNVISDENAIIRACVGRFNEIFSPQQGVTMFLSVSFLL